MLGDLYANTAPAPLNSTSSHEPSLRQTTHVDTAMTRTKSGDSDDWFKLTESGFQGSQEDITGGKPSFGAYTQEDNPDGPGLQRERQFGGRNQE